MESFSYVLEQGKVEDCQRIWEVRHDAISQLCSSHYNEKEISAWVGKQKKETYIPLLEIGKIIVAKKTGKVVGFIHHQECIKETDSIEAQMKGLFIDPTCAQSGLGRLLFKEMEATALKQRARRITVSASLNALPFYEKMGFIEIGKQPWEFTCHCTVQCVSMVKDLTKQ